jgi:hypothetical protein
MIYLYTNNACTLLQYGVLSTELAKDLVGKVDEIESALDTPGKVLQGLGGAGAVLFVLGIILFINATYCSRRGHSV